VDRLPPGTVRLGANVSGLTRLEDGRWLVTQDSDPVDGDTFDAVVIATQAWAAADLLKHIDGTLADELAAIHHSSCATVSLTYERSQISHPMDGFGFVVPAVEKRRILSASFSSVKYPGRAPDGKVLIRVFMGGALQPELVELPDKKLEQVASEELAACMGIAGTPLSARIARLPCSMPQYYVGHKERVAAIEQRAEDARGLFVIGNALRGVGIPYCVRGAEQVAERLVEYLKGT
jgi:oxygen-dependent protoporphyrinogen oxidase